MLEAETAKHKSSRSKEQQKELLPFTALGQLLDDDSWAEAWMIARKSAGAEHWKHFLCSWSEHRHCWTDSRMSTAEGSGWLREFLEPTEGAARASSLTAHGLKATMLKWAAKSLLFTPERAAGAGTPCQLSLQISIDLLPRQSDWLVQEDLRLLGKDQGWNLQAGWQQGAKASSAYDGAS